MADASFLCVDVPIAHSLADASVAVAVGVVAEIAQFFADPPTAANEPCAYSFAEYSVEAEEVSASVTTDPV